MKLEIENSLWVYFFANFNCWVCFFVDFYMWGFDLKIEKNGNNSWVFCYFFNKKIEKVSSFSILASMEFFSKKKASMEFENKLWVSFFFL